MKALSYHKKGSQKKIPMIQLGINYGVLFNPPDMFFGESFQSRYICFHISHIQETKRDNERIENSNGRVYLGAYAINRPLSSLKVIKSVVTQKYSHASAFQGPKGICVRPTTGFIYVTNSKNASITVLLPDMTILKEIFLTVEQESMLGTVMKDNEDGSELGGGGMEFMKQMMRRWTLSTPNQRAPERSSRDVAGRVIRFSPIDIAFEKSGKGYAVVDQNHDCIVLFDENDRFILAVGSKGRSKYQFDTPICVDYDSLGNIHVSDSKNNRIQRFSSTGKFIQSIPFSRIGEIHSFGGSVHGLRIRHDQMYVTISDAPIIVILTPTGQFLQYFGVEEHPKSWVGFSPLGGFFIHDRYSKFHFYNEDGTTKKKIVIKMPGGATFNPSHQLIVTNYLEDCVVLYEVDMYSNSIEFLSNSTTLSDSEFCHRIRPKSISIHPITQHIYTIDSERNRIDMFSAQLKHIGVFNPPNATITKPQSISFSNDGDTMIVSDSSTRFISVFSKQGVLTANSTMIPPGELLSLVPGGVVTDHAGNIFAMDSTHSFIFKYNASGEKVCHTEIEPRLTDKRNHWPMVVNDENELMVCLRGRPVIDVYCTTTLKILRSMEHPFGQITFLARGPNQTLAICGLSKDPKCPQSILFYSTSGNILKTIDVHEASSIIFNSQGRLFITKPGGILEY